MDIQVRDGQSGALRRRFAIPTGCSFGAADDRWLWFNRPDDRTGQSWAVAVDEVGDSGPVVELPPASTVIDASDGLLLTEVPVFFDTSDLAVVDLDGVVRFERRLMDPQAVLGDGVLYIGTPTTELDVIAVRGEVHPPAGPSPAFAADAESGTATRCSIAAAANGRWELWHLAGPEPAPTTSISTRTSARDVRSHILWIGEDAVSQHRVLPFHTVGLLAVDETIIVLATDPPRQHDHHEQAGPVALHVFDRNLAPIGQVRLGTEPLRGQAVAVRTHG